MLMLTRTDHGAASSLPIVEIAGAGAADGVAVGASDFMRPPTQKHKGVRGRGAATATAPNGQWNGNGHHPGPRPGSPAGAPPTPIHHPSNPRPLQRTKRTWKLELLAVAGGVARPGSGLCSPCFGAAGGRMLSIVLFPDMR